MSTEPAEPSLAEKLLIGAAAVVICAALGVCTGLAEVAHYGDWECFAKRCTVHPDADGDGDASSIP